METSLYSSITEEYFSVADFHFCYCDQTTLALKVLFITKKLMKENLYDRWKEDDNLV